MQPLHIHLQQKELQLRERAREAADPRAPALSAPPDAGAGVDGKPVTKPQGAAAERAGASSIIAPPGAEQLAVLTSQSTKGAEAAADCSTDACVASVGATAGNGRLCAPSSAAATAPRVEPPSATAGNGAASIHSADAGVAASRTATPPPASPWAEDSRYARNRTPTPAASSWAAETVGVGVDSVAPVQQPGAGAVAMPGDEQTGAPAYIYIYLYIYIYIYR